MTAQLTLVPQPTATERLSTFMQKMLKTQCTPEFIQNKAFDYALALPEVWKQRSQVERLDAAVELIGEASDLCRQWLEGELEHQELQDRVE